MPGTLRPEAPIAAVAMSPEAFWKARYSAAPGTSFATHIDPSITIVTPCIIAAASGGTCWPVISPMFIRVVNVYSSHLTPSIACDLPVGVSVASTLGNVTLGLAGGVPAGAVLPAAGAEAVGGGTADAIVAVF